MQPEPALLPADPFAAGKVVELVCHIKLDVELVARRCLPEAFFGGQVSDETKESTKNDLAKGMASLDRIFVGAPYAAGSELSAGRLLHILQLWARGRDRSEDFRGRSSRPITPKSRASMAHMAEHPSVARVGAEQAS